MKIVHVSLCCNSYKDGWSYQENCLPRYQKQAGYNVEMITVPFTINVNTGGRQVYQKKHYTDEKGVKITRLPLLFSNKSKISARFRLYKGLYKSLVKADPDILFVHGCQFIDIRYIVSYAKKNPNTRIFVDGHEDFRNSARNWISKNILHKIIWKYCANLIEPYTLKFWGVTPARVDFLIQMYDLPKNKVDLLVMGAEDEKVEEARDDISRKAIRSKYGIEEEDFLIITGGKLDYNKPQTLLLMEAVKNINIKTIKMIFFGSIMPEYKDKVSDLLCESVQYIGWVEPKDTYKYFYAGDLVIFPGLHSVFWEQVVGLGKPCVFKYMEGFTHVDLGGNCLFLYEDSVSEIQSTILKIYNNKQLFQRMNDIAIEKGLNYFSYKRIAKISIE